MLVGLAVKNFVLASDIEVSFERKLTVLLGETGAGKSVLIAALAIVCGGKTAYGQVLNVTKKAYIEAVFKPAPTFLVLHPALTEFLAGEDTLILTASMTAKGTIVRKANGQTMTGAMLRELTTDLVSIHSQNDNDTLFKSASQLAILDDYGGLKVQEGLTAYQKAYCAWTSKTKAVADLLAENANVDPEFLRYRIAEIEKFALHADEIENLEERLKTLSAAVSIEDTLMRLKPGVSIFQSVEGDLRRHLAALKETTLAVDADIALSGLNALADGLTRLEQESLAEDPREIERLNQRLFALEPLRIKYGRTSAEILKALNDFHEQLAGLENFENRRQDLVKESEEARQLAEEKALGLTALREEVALRLAQEIGVELKDLSLPEDGFKVALSPTAPLTMTGHDKITFVVRLNKGVAYLPLAGAISGGEGSRLMLALKSVLAKTMPANTLVFDEIDSGISGTIAFKAGLKLHHLASSSQVICITHLPQVAAFADGLVWVQKKTADAGSETVAVNVKSADLPIKVAELIKGSGESPSVLLTATELVNQARKATGEV